MNQEKKNPYSLCCLLNCLRSGNVFLTRGAGVTPSCWTAPLCLHHRHVNSVTRLIPRHRSPPICFLSFLSLSLSFFKHFFLPGKFRSFPLKRPELLPPPDSRVYLEMQVRLCPPYLTPIPLQNWQPTPTHTYIHTHRIPIMAADVAHLARGVTHYSWLALMFCSPFSLSVPPWQLTNVWQEVFGIVPG